MTALTSNSPGLDPATRQQLKDLEQEAEIKKLTERMEILASHINASELRLNKLASQVELVEKDRHTHISQLEVNPPKGNGKPEPKELKPKTKLSDLLKKLGL